MDATRELLLRWHRGDQDALAELVRQDAQWIGARVRRKLGSSLRRRQDTEDIVQNAMIDVLKCGPRFVVADREHFRALIARFVENALLVQIDHAQAGMRDVRREVAPPTGESIVFLDRQPGDATRPNEAVARDETKALVRLALELLEPEDRNAVVWRDYDDLPFAEIASRLQVAEDAARMRYNRAVRKLARKVKSLREGRLDALLQESG